MELASQVEIENELKSLSWEQLRAERADITKQLKQIQEDIGDLAFNNYRTYAAAGRTTQDCTEIFTEMNEKLREVTGDISSLQSELKSFQGNSKSVSTELELLKTASEHASPLWEMLALPARMDLCIRSGYYEAAYSLTNYGMLMQQHAMVKNPLLKNIADRLVEARSLLLEELFNKFSGPMDLASSLQVVNNVRKMPYLTPTQLRVSILQHKDVYLEKQLMDISSHPDFAIAAIDVYRTCMHDTLVLYLSVFPENETMKRDPSVDPRWEQWPPSAPSAVLGQWAARNISRLLDLIHRAEMKSGVDMASVWSKMMSIAATFGRMGLDFRPLIVQSLTQLVLDRFKTAVRKATARLVNDVKVLSIFSGDVSAFDEAGKTTQPGAAPIPSPEISMWDDICIYANDVLTALNGMRYSHSPMLLPTVASSLNDSLVSVLCWLSSFHTSPHFSRAVRIVCLHLAPFLSNCVRFLFPYDVVSRLFGTAISRQQFRTFTELDVKDLAAACDGSEHIEEILLPLLRKKSLSQIDVDAVLKKPHQPQEEDEVVVAPADQGSHQETTEGRSPFTAETPVVQMPSENHLASSDAPVAEIVIPSLQETPSLVHEPATSSILLEPLFNGSHHDPAPEVSPSPQLQHTVEPAVVEPASSLGSHHEVSPQLLDTVEPPVPASSFGSHHEPSLAIDPVSETLESIGNKVEVETTAVPIPVPAEASWSAISLSSPTEKPQVIQEQQNDWGEEDADWGWDEKRGKKD